MSQFALSDSFEYVCYGSTIIINMTILTTKVDPRAVVLKVKLTLIHKCTIINHVDTISNYL